ncbi:MAG: zinc-ribbon domain containing protein [Hyphomicrobiaceae bacterium]|nr:zinc-ribbon domain containing protein [Hyphomicrobiaceae bacterium]
MKSGRQRRNEILARRRTRSSIARRFSPAPWEETDRIPRGALLADPAKLVHDGTYGPRPRYYVDTPFACVDCGAAEVWSALDQKWWYEEAKGKLDSRANRCRECRRKRRMRRSQERRVHVEGLVAKHGLDGAAARLGWSVEALARTRARWTEV